jgi:YspA, cpYpsA-related SLOG family
MLIVVTGSRTWTDRNLMRDVLLRIKGAAQEPTGRRTGLMHGASPGGGADLIAGELATSFGWSVLARPPRTRSRDSYLARNRAMIDEAAMARLTEGTRVVVAAFAMPCDRPSCGRHMTHGTGHTVALARDAGLEVHVTWAPGTMPSLGPATSVTPERADVEPPEPPRSRTGDPETSVESGEGVDARGARAQVLAWMVEHDRPEGWTWGELPDGVGGYCNWKRMSELRQLGYLEWALDDAGHKVRRQGPTSGGVGTQGASRPTAKGFEAVASGAVIPPRTATAEGVR